MTFKAPPAQIGKASSDDAKSTISRWRSNSDLVRKHYLVSDDGRTCAGLYLWPTRAAAGRAHDASWRAAIEKRTGTAPKIRLFDLMMVLDNETGTITEWSQTGEMSVSRRMP